MITEAVILAGGVGQRLDRPDKPKPLVSVGHKPLIVWNIEQLQDAGVTTIHIVVGHRADEIIKELTGNKFVRAELNFITQQDNSKSGMTNAICSLEGKVNEPFFLTMADLIIDQNPYTLFDVAHKSLTTLIDLDTERCERSGALSQVLLKDNRVHTLGRSLERCDGLELGVYLFGKGAIKDIKRAAAKQNDARFDDVLSAMAGKGTLHAQTLQQGDWFDVNTPSTLIRAELFLRGKFSVVTRHTRTGGLAQAATYTRFAREKKLHTDITIEHNGLRKLDTLEIIPHNRMDSPHFVITDTTVDALYGSPVMEKFTAAGYNMRKLVVEPGEQVKNTGTFTDLADELFFYGVDEESVLVSLGGGVINNLVGMLASTMYRGIGLVHIPTTTMAQMDAAIDFKQAVNSPHGKNLLGAYYPAMRVLIDTSVIATLDKRHVRNGIAEALKHALTQDKNLLDYFLKYKGEYTAPAFIEEVTRRTIDLKVHTLNNYDASDVNEMAPQYGHSIGHAIEYLSGYTLLHGEAVSIGMCVSAEIAKLLGLCDHAVVDTHYRLCERYELPTTVPDDIHEDDVIAAIRYDKHYLKGNPRMGLVAHLGTLWNEKGIHAIPIDYATVRRALGANKARAAR